MQRGRRKNSRLQERLDSLQRELARVESDIKGISHAIDSPDPEQVRRRLSKVSIQEAPRASSPEPIFETPVSQGTAYTEDVAIPKPVPDQRFQTYFGSGSLHSVRPLRQERRVQRNKAVFMFVLALVFLYFVYNLIF
ncbi:MAG: hypothetical protein WCO42_00355 [bacterium]